jgi:hypothetical protein
MQHKPLAQTIKNNNSHTILVISDESSAEDYEFNWEISKLTKK